MEYPFKDLMPLDEATARTGYYRDWTHIDADTFHQISELVKFIREKGYGADTREAIAQALERVYHDAMKSGNADMELSMARRHFKDLASRLDASDQKLDSNTANLSQKIGGGVKAEPEDLSASTLALVTGQGTVNLLTVPQNQSVTRPKVVQGSIGYNETDFLKIGKNLFNKDLVVPGQLVSTGNINASGLYSVGPLIYVKAGETISLSSPRNYMFYNVSQEPLSDTYDYSNASMLPITVTAPSNGYIRYTIHNRDLNTFMVVKGSLPATFEPFEVTIEGLKVDETGIQDGAIAKEHFKKGDVIDVSANLFDARNITPNKYITSTGLQDSASYDTSDFIKIVHGQNYHISEGLRNLAYYDDDKAFMTLVDPAETTFPNSRYSFTPPSDAVYFRVATFKSRTNSVMLNTGVSLLPFEKAGVSISQLNLGGLENINKDFALKSRAKVLEGSTLLNFGDSIAAGDGDRDSSNLPIGYSRRIGELTGMTVYNRAKGGATIGKSTTHTVLEQVELAITDGLTADFILFNGYFNDIASYNVPLGTISSGYDAPLDITTFSGGFEQTIKTMSQTWLGAKIIYVTAHKSRGRGQNDQKVYRERALEICDKWSIPVVDMWLEGGINLNLSWHEGVYCAQGDPSHPNGLGYDKYFVPKILSKLIEVGGV